MSVQLAVSIFLLGTSVGALLVGLQHAATRRHFIAVVTEERDWTRSIDSRPETSVETPVGGRPN